MLFQWRRSRLGLRDGGFLLAVVELLLLGAAPALVLHRGEAALGGGELAPLQSSKFADPARDATGKRAPRRAAGSLASVHDADSRRASRNGSPRSGGRRAPVPPHQVTSELSSHDLLVRLKGLIHPMLGQR